ncbi:metal dependent phosphohydrolase [Alteromonas macleodii str. 'Black Sea 11']|jgi:putative nucleotidyltransferase with HDIG domain|uniref:HD-GYP domain-containing protein n=1 Tax=Alteromonas abrolhosensis TaxID=1892904 RepID=UPI000286E988|nr:HD-GYP domain-containing protein [Alteromonas abrolhosensis]AFT80340.1 metal dependent phosphohydrolase [Alteromonas macleodii str. 'Black Sea 11']NKW90462.1 HD-GYP domain-containing protein [Alteromonadaceae bacterium A_SAG4]NKX17651.1 HD-GYP domain-containing protein [Alteromonadaceae bacterium A_SAG5]NKX20004.1 HD-GYP domain-containing protein [Alteromonadaceae bacterium A_SAG8]NKX34032.1 HD-GYP domain-containing protein [Alteromonadaceae bacterium A_SAG3]
MIKKITIDQLVPGMFVHQILEQKGALKVKSQGRVTSDDVITALKKRGVKTLAIDTDKAFNVGERESSSAAETCPTPTSTDSVKSKKVSLENELVRAEKLHKQGKAIQKLLLASVQKEMPFDASIPKAFSSKLVASVDRNPDALLCLTKIREKDDYLLEHSLNVAILLANFANYLGMSEDEVQDLSYAGFLHDLGKIKIPDEILHKPGRLTDSEMEVMKGHVKHGVDYLKSTEIAPPLIQAISEHHERLDGLGYPAGTKGDDISQAGRMLAIADMYDALTADRVYKPGMSSQRAFSILMSDAPTRLDQSLVQQFIKCLGVYPVGSLVLLSNDRLAMVLEQKDSPLTPLVKVFYSVRNNHYLTPKDIDLSSDKTVNITKAVVASDYKIDVNTFFERSVSIG